MASRKEPSKRREIDENASDDTVDQRIETVRVSYRIDKRGRSETYEVFGTKQAPRFLVKEKFPNGSAVELVELTKSTSDLS
jgi:hypothetical protein